MNKVATTDRLNRVYKMPTGLSLKRNPHVLNSIDSLNLIYLLYSLYSSLIFL